MKIEINEETFEELVLCYLKDLHHTAEEALDGVEHPEDIENWRRIRDSVKTLVESNWPYIKLRNREDA